MSSNIVCIFLISKLKCNWILHPNIAIITLLFIYIFIIIEKDKENLFICFLLQTFSFNSFYLSVLSFHTLQCLLVTATFETWQQIAARRSSKQTKKSNQFFRLAWRFSHVSTARATIPNEHLITETIFNLSYNIVVLSFENLCVLAIFVK